jgi:feruloyl-CoA synthase
MSIAKKISGPFRPLPLGKNEIHCTPLADGSTLLRSTSELQAYPATLTEQLRHWATHRPEAVFLAQRDSLQRWQTLTFAQALHKVETVASALLPLGLSADRPIAILSDNDLDHAVLALAAMHIGVPYAPISSAYSLLGDELSKLRHVLGTLTPGLVFAADGQRFARALCDYVSADATLLVSSMVPATRSALLFQDLLQTPISPAMHAAAAKVGPDHIAKFLFSSGSTGLPKGVINTQRMLCANQQMILQSLPSLRLTPPVIVDWLPWNHTFGGNHDFGIALYNGGSLYIDHGKPVPGLFATTVQNLREIAPTAYFNVPKGFELLVEQLARDAAFAKHFFSRLQFMFYAGAGLPQHIWDSLDELALSAVGERIVMITGIGCTETAPSATFANFQRGRSGGLGLPVPGIDFKLTPSGQKLEARVRGPSVTPGYWRAPELTRKAFDEDGYFKMGDAVKWADTNDPQQGLIFDGRITEDFKLSSGTWVSVGPLRARTVSAYAPLLRDVVLSGRDRNDIVALLFPDFAACRKLCPQLSADADNETVLQQPQLRQQFQTLLNKQAQQATGSATRIARAMLMAEIPTVATGEATDKGSLNCAAVLERRSALVERLYAAGTDPEVIRPS